jgi:glycosyltransferase involved in cell wall biosynthesis
VVYPGLRQEYFDSAREKVHGSSTRDPFFLFVGTFAVRKNLKTTVQAFAKIHTQVRERLVVVAYPGPNKQGILDLASNLGVHEKIDFVSGLSTNQMASLYRRATCVVLLSEYEGFGYPPLEAMACGTPAIVSDSSSLGEVVGDAGVKASPTDVDAAAASMAKISQNSQLQVKLSLKSREHAERFRWENSQKQLATALNLTKVCCRIPEIAAAT